MEKKGVTKNYLCTYILATHHECQVCIGWPQQKFSLFADVMQIESQRTICVLRAFYAYT